MISGDTTTTIATKLATAINGNAALAAIGVTATSSTNTLRIQTYSYNNTTFTESVSGSETITLTAFQGTPIYIANNANWTSVVKPALTTAGYTSTELAAIAKSVSSYATATITGSVAIGDVLKITVTDSALTTNPTTVSYTTISGDTTTSIATKLATAINANSVLSAAGITATSSTNVLTLLSLTGNATFYNQSVTTGAESIFLPNLAFASIAGNVASGGGDVLNIFVHDAGLSTNPTQVSYHTVAGDTVNTIAAALANAINSTPTLAAIGVIAGSVANVLEIQSTSTHVTTYTESVTTGSESITLFYDTGETAIIPDQPHVYVGKYFIGYGYYLLAPLGNEFFGPLNNTGKGANSDTCTDSQCNAGSSGNSPSSGVLLSGYAQFTDDLSSEPIDLVSGAYVYTNTDISVGNQSEPYQLDFHRSYNSANSVRENGLGWGWNHNFQITAAMNSDGFIAFGYDSVSAAAAVIAEMYVCQDILQSSSPAISIQNAVTICVANQWLMNQIANNTAIVQFGSYAQFFAKLPNGNYVAPIGVKTSTNLEYSGTFTYTTPDKIVYSFSSSGQISSISYPFGITTSFTYTSGLLTTVSNGFRSLTLNYSGTNLASVSDGSRTVFYTVASNNLTQFKDPLGNTTTYSYASHGPSSGLLYQVFQPANPSCAIVANEYDTLGRVKQQADAYGNMWSYYFAGNRSEEDDPNGFSRIWYFDAYGSVLQFTDQLGNTTLTQYDGLERTTLVTLPEGNSFAFQYDANCNLLLAVAAPKPGSGLGDITLTYTYDLSWNKVKTAQDGNGNTVTFTYDPVTGQLTQIQYPTVSAGVPYVYFSYNSIGQLVTATDPTGIISSFAYDPTTKNLLTQVLDSGSGHLNLTTTFTYDTVGNYSTIEDPNGNIAAVSFDANRRLIQVLDPTPFNGVTAYNYDANNNLIQVQCQAANSIQQRYILSYSATYTIDNLVSSISEPPINANRQQPSACVYGYDNLRRLNQETDADGNTYVSIFDALSRVTQVIYPNGVIGNTRVYTPNGYLKSFVDTNENETLLTLDGFDRLATATYADTTSEQFAYDNNDNVTQITTRGGNTIGFVYDAMDQIMTKSPQGQAVVTYAFDLAGRLIEASVPVVPGDPSTGAFQQYYDTAGRFYKETYPSGQTVTLGLDGNGNVVSMTYPDSSIVTRTYDQLNRLTGVSDSNGSTVFGFDILSRRTSQVYGNGISCGFGYDLGNNLLSLIFNTSPTLQFNYEYDSTHQLISQQVSSSSYLWEPTPGTVSYGTANSVNQYPSVAGQSYSYNANGCLTGDGTFTYSYNTENQLVGVIGTGVSVTFKYDPLGRQVLKISGSTTTQFVYCGLQHIADYNSSGGLLNKYISSDSPDEILWAETAGNVTYFHSDEIGSVIMTSSASGVISSDAPFSPWGEATSVNSFNIAFTGQRYDPEIGLCYYKARYYSPSLGRFLQPDPICYGAGQLNLYLYADSNPLNEFDSLGLNPADDSSTTGDGQPAGFSFMQTIPAASQIPNMGRFVGTAAIAQAAEGAGRFSGNPATISFSHSICFSLN